MAPNWRTRDRFTRRGYRSDVRNVPTSFRVSANTASSSANVGSNATRSRRSATSRATAASSAPVHAAASAGLDAAATTPRLAASEVKRSCNVPQRPRRRRARATTGEADGCHEPERSAPTRGRAGGDDRPRNVPIPATRSAPTESISASADSGTDAVGSNACQTDLREPDLDPRVSVTGADLVDAGDLIALARHVSRRQACRDALGPEHDRECRRDLLAEPTLRVEQEVVHRILAGVRQRRIEVVLHVGRHPRLIGADDVVRRRPSGRQLVREVDRLGRRGGGDLEVGGQEQPAHGVQPLTDEPLTCKQCLVDRVRVRRRPCTPSRPAAPWWRGARHPDA